MRQYLKKLPDFNWLLPTLGPIIITLFAGLVSGIGEVSIIGSTVAVVIVFIYLYRWLGGKVRNILGFLIMALLAFWGIPCLEYYLYKKNNRYFTPTETFIKSESALAKELSRGKLEFYDLYRVFQRLKEKTTFPPDKHVVMSFLIDNTDTIHIPELITIKKDDFFAINSHGWEFSFCKGNSLKTSIQFKADHPNNST